MSHLALCTGKVFLCFFVCCLFFSVSQVIGCDACLQNNLDYVGCSIKQYFNSVSNFYASTSFMLKGLTRFGTTENEFEQLTHAVTQRVELYITKTSQDDTIFYTSWM